MIYHVTFDSEVRRAPWNSNHVMVSRFVRKLFNSQLNYHYHAYLFPFLKHAVSVSSSFYAWKMVCNEAISEAAELLSGNPETLEHMKLNVIGLTRVVGYYIAVACPHPYLRADYTETKFLISVHLKTILTTPLKLTRKWHVQQMQKTIYKENTGIHTNHHHFFNLPVIGIKKQC